MDVLIVDDHPLFGDGLSALIEREQIDLQVERAESCSAAVKACVDRQGSPRTFDLVFLDLTLRDTVGVETLQNFREHAPWVPVVVISAQENDSLVHECIEIGAMGFIPKTFSREALMHAVRNVLNRQVFVPDRSCVSFKAETDTPRILP